MVARLAADEYALSANAAPGRIRGRPVPRRAMRTWFSSGMNCGQSPCWPGVKMRVTGRQPRSAARWILVVRPPRDRPSASWRPARRILVIRRCPVTSSAGGSCRAPAACWCARITVESALRAQSGPSAWSHPARSRSRTFCQVPSSDQRRCRLYAVFQCPYSPGRSRQGQPVRVRKQDPVDHHPVITPAASPPGIGRHRRQQTLPFLISKVMTTQAIIHSP